MISFRGDYSEGAHERILEALSKTNREQTEVYGDDRYTQNAKRLIQEKLNCNQCMIRFLVGGTQTNQVAISHFLRPHQAVIATAFGHINVHETGAIETTGHKVIAVEANDGKLRPAHVRQVMAEHTDFHMVQPKMVYISNTTEIGTVYKKAELIALREICDVYGLYLYVDGARLAMALTAADNDITLADYARYTDAFYIGGTKNGALFGEALVVVNQSLQEDLDYSIKQQGALLAKGSVLGLQFETLFTGGLYEMLGQNANAMAQKLKNGLKEKGYAFMIDSPSNQQFVIMDNAVAEEMNKEFIFKPWAPIDETKSIVRFVTSWATTAEQVESLLGALPIND